MRALRKATASALRSEAARLAATALGTAFGLALGVFFVGLAWRLCCLAWALGAGE